MITLRIEKLIENGVHNGYLVLRGRAPRIQQLATYRVDPTQPEALDEAYSKAIRCAEEIAVYGH